MKGFLREAEVRFKIIAQDPVVMGVISGAGFAKMRQASPSFENVPLVAEEEGVPTEDKDVHFPNTHPAVLVPMTQFSPHGRSVLSGKALAISNRNSGLIRWGARTL
jgi:hypothetical protein